MGDLSVYAYSHCQTCKLATVLLRTVATARLTVVLSFPRLAPLPCVRVVHSLVSIRAPCWLPSGFRWVHFPDIHSLYLGQTTVLQEAEIGRKLRRRCTFLPNYLDLRQSLPRGCDPSEQQGSCASLATAWSSPDPRIHKVHTQEAVRAIG